MKTPQEILDNYQMFNFDEAFTDRELLYIKNAMELYQKQFVEEQAGEYRSLESDLNQVAYEKGQLEIRLSELEDKVDRIVGFLNL